MRLSRLQNMEHYQFASHMLAMCREAGIAKLNPVLTPLQKAFEKEDKALNQPRQEEGTKELEELDKVRDTAYRVLRLLIDLHLHSDDAALHTSAEKLSEVVARYPKVAAANYDKESGMLKNLVTDLRATTLTAHVTKLAAKPYIDRLEKANTAFDQRYRSRLKVAVSTDMFDIKTLRAATDIALNAVVRRMDSLDDLEPATPKLADLIAQYNALVEKRRTTIAHRAATNKAAREKKDNKPKDNAHVEELKRLKVMITEYEQSSHFTPGIVQFTGLSAGKDATRAYQVYLSDQPDDLFWLTVKDGKLTEIEFKLSPDSREAGNGEDKIDLQNF